MIQPNPVQLCQTGEGRYVGYIVLLQPEPLNVDKLREWGDVGYLVAAQLDVIQRDEAGKRREVGYRIMAQFYPDKIDSEFQTCQVADAEVIGVKFGERCKFLARDLCPFLLTEVFG